MIKQTRLFVAMMAAALTLSFSSANAQLQPGDPGYFTWLYSHVRASLINTVLQVREFSVARAADDQMGMEVNAFELLGALIAAEEWTGALDRTVTAANFSPEIDEAVADLAARGHEVRVVPHVGGGMNAIECEKDGTMQGAACWRADGTVAAIGGGLARPGVRFWPGKAPEDEKGAP